MDSRDPNVVSEREVVFLVGLAQFVNILEFMIVLPLGPDYARELAIEPAQLGLVGSAYTAAAAVGGVLASRVLDRFDRRSALTATTLGLVIATVAAGVATSRAGFLSARLLAGLFGGPATAVGLSVVSDLVPTERRGKALGAVMGAFSVASVVGVPLGLEVGRHFGWRVPLFLVALLGAVVLVGVLARLPSMRAHLESRREPMNPLELLRRPGTLFAVVATMSISLAGFAIIPNVSAYMQANCALPREQLPFLYFAGGLPTFFTLRLAGRLADEYGAPRVAFVGTLLFVAIVTLGFAFDHSLVHPVAVFVFMMSAQSTRNVASQTLTSRLPAPHERAGFQSLQSAVQHLGSALGASLGSVFLATAPSGKLVGMPGLAAFSVLVALPLPFVIARLAAALDARVHAEQMAAPAR